MQKLNNSSMKIPLGLRARTLDFYVAFLVFFIGFSGIADPTWPERFSHSWEYWLVFVEDIYLMVASVVIMASLIIREKKSCKINVLIPSIIGEMFGWLFISTASAVIILSSWWIPPSALVEETNSVSFFAWILIWLGLGISSFLRYLDLRIHYRSHS